MSETSRQDARKLRNLNFDLANYFSNTIIPQLFVDSEMKLRIFTPPAMEQFSLTYDDIDKHIGEVKDNIRYPTFVEDIEEVIKSNEIFEKEIQTTDRNWFQMNIVPYVEHEENEINGVIITFVNITKRLAIISELERMNAEHNVLMYALSHDLKQPISTITLLADGLVETFEQQDLNQFNLWIDRLKKTSDGLSTMLDEYTSDGQANLQKNITENRHNLTEICNDVLDALREEIKAKNIEVIKTFKIFEVKFPRNNLRSIVYNLLHNAVKYNDSGEASKIKISTYKKEAYVVFEVEDNGMGIAKENQKSIFQKSSRINSDIEGTGMGLYIINKMIENNKGKIEVDSTLGKGSRFRVFFKNGSPGVHEN